MTYLLLAIIILAVLSAVITRSRTAQLKRMARTLNLRYDKQVDSVLLPDSSANAQFLKHGLHQFLHVLTFQEAGAFVRVCEDRIFASPLDKKPLHTYTLVAAELTNGTFIPFVLTPRTQDKDPNLPPELAARYTLTAPEGFTLPPVVTGFLKAHPTCYVECTKTALLYCEFNITSVAQLQPLRFRALQLLKELAKKEEPVQTVQSTVPPAVKLTDEELQAQLLLKLQSAPHGTVTPSGANGRYVYGIVLLAVLSTVLFITWYALHHWVAR